MGAPIQVPLRGGSVRMSGAPSLRRLCTAPERSGAAVVPRGPPLDRATPCVPTRPSQQGPHFQGPISARGRGGGLVPEGGGRPWRRRPVRGGQWGIGDGVFWEDHWPHGRHRFAGPGSPRSQKTYNSSVERCS